MSEKTKDTILYIVIMLILIAGVFSMLYRMVESEEQEKERACTCWKKVEAKVTAYVPITERHGKFNDGKTSLMDDATVLDGVAVAPTAIPYRSQIFIPGVGVKEADDTGSALRRSWKKGVVHIDLRVRNSRIANKWGVKRLTVFVKEESADE